MVVINGGNDFLRLCFASWFTKKFNISFYPLGDSVWKLGGFHISLFSPVTLVGLTADQELNPGLSGTAW